MEQTDMTPLFGGLFSLLDKELIEKVLAISKAVKVEKLEDGTVRITVDLKVQ